MRKSGSHVVIVTYEVTSGYERTVILDIPAELMPAPVAVPWLLDRVLRRLLHRGRVQHGG